MFCPYTQTSSHPRTPSSFDTRGRVRMLDDDRLRLYFNQGSHAIPHGIAPHTFFEAVANSVVSHIWTAWSRFDDAEAANITPECSRICRDHNARYYTRPYVNVFFSDYYNQIESAEAERIHGAVHTVTEAMATSYTYFVLATLQGQCPIELTDIEFQSIDHSYREQQENPAEGLEGFYNAKEFVFSICMRVIEEWERQGGETIEPHEFFSLGRDIKNLLNNIASGTRDDSTPRMINLLYFEDAITFQHDKAGNPRFSVNPKEPQDMLRFGRQEKGWTDRDMLQLGEPHKGCPAQQTILGGTDRNFLNRTINKVFDAFAQTAFLRTQACVHTPRVSGLECNV